MKWSQPADRKVVDAIVATFSEPINRLPGILSPLSQDQWERTFHWLDASGMALYFVARLESLGLQGAIPAATLARLQQNLVDSHNRSASMYAEFIQLNRAFQEAEIDYCNLKGFTLSPGSCPDPVLRCQLDFDFLVEPKDLELCRRVLVQHGYVLRNATTVVWEFKTDSNELAHIADHYKPKQQRCAEVHFRCTDEEPHRPARDQRLDRLVWQTHDGLKVPALSSVDQFIGQATHLLEHLSSPCTRLAWLLEFKNHIDVHSDDHQFWSEVLDRAAMVHVGPMALGVSCLLAESVLGAEIPDALRQSTVSCLPEGVALWVERYGRRALLADGPGTKLNLLLREQMNLGNPGWKTERRKVLLPLRRAPRIIHVDRDAGLWSRLRGEYYQLRFVLFRLRFHLVEGLRYMAENIRWQRDLKLRHALRHQEPTLPQLYES